MLFSKGNDKRICLFGCSMISLLKWAKRLSFDSVDPMSTSGFGKQTCMHLLGWSEVLRKSHRLFDKRSDFSFADFRFLEEITLLRLYIAKLEQLDCKRFFVGAPANTHYSMLGLGSVKNVVAKITIYVSIVHKLLWYLFVKRKKFAQTGILLFDRHQLDLISKFCKMNLSIV